MDWGPWWTTVHGVAKSGKWLKQLSTQVLYEPIVNLGYSDPWKTLSVPLIHPTHSMKALTSLLFHLSGCKMPSSILLLYVPRLGNINKWTSLAFTHSPMLSLHPAEERIMSMGFSTSLELRKPELQDQLSSNLLTQSFWKELWVTQTLIWKLLWNIWG